MEGVFLSCSPKYAEKVLFEGLSRKKALRGKVTRRTVRTGNSGYCIILAFEKIRIGMLKCAPATVAIDNLSGKTRVLALVKSTTDMGIVSHFPRSGVKQSNASSAPNIIYKLFHGLR